MKLKPILLSSLFAALAAFPFSVQAASDMDKATEPTASTTSMQAEKPMKKAMKPHSHVQEKTGMPPNAPEATASKPSPMQDKSKHYHPRDGK